MKRPEVISRNYHISDEEMLQQSDLKLVAFDENKSQFVERFPQLADPFADEWATATNFARRIAPDYASLANQTGQTDVLKALVSQGANIYQALLLYVRLAYPNDASVLRLFGQHQYEAARNSQLKLPVLLRTAHTQAMKPEYNAALIAKGMKIQEIDALEAMAESITVQNILQEKAMKDRSNDLDNRVTALNSVWNMMALVCQCAKLVFQDDATRYNLFLLSDGESPTEKPGDNLTDAEYLD